LPLPTNGKEKGGKRKKKGKSVRKKGERSLGGRGGIQPYAVLPSHF